MPNNGFPLAVGFVWYKREDYEAIKTLFGRETNLPATFDEWLRKAEIGFKKMESDGRIVIKAYIDPATFPDWCKAHGHNLDSRGRSEYATWYAMKQIMK